ncbi:MAG: hypothetical protein IJJ00_04370 [Erysipelotrichaceae bacterium]|nr:hypothetical protein [Erysipelotrichaceae bacterium]
MKNLFEEYGESIISLICSLVIVTMFISVFLIEVLGTNAGMIGDNTVEARPAAPEDEIRIRAFSVRDILITQGEEINWNGRIEATNNRGDYSGSDEDISSYVSLYGDVDTSSPGVKEATYVLRYNGETRFAKARVIVTPREEEL